MTVGGPYDKGAEKEQVFKCKDCGAETHGKKGWNGEPDTHHCAAGCPSRRTDWTPGDVSAAYRRNYDRIFQNSPGVRQAT